MNDLIEKMPVNPAAFGVLYDSPRLTYKSDKLTVGSKYEIVRPSQVPRLKWQCFKLWFIRLFKKHYKRSIVQVTQIESKVITVDRLPDDVRLTDYLKRLR